MTDFEIRPTTVQADQASSVQIESSKTTAPELKPSDPKTSEVAEKIFSSSTQSATLPKKLDEHNFELNSQITNENESHASEKAELVGTPILSASADKEDVHLQELQQNDVQAKQKIENELGIDEHSLSDKIKLMNEDELIEALDNPDFDSHLDEIMARLDELGEDINTAIAENEESISEIDETITTKLEERSVKTENKTQESQASQVKETQALKLEDTVAESVRTLVGLTPKGATQNFTGNEGEDLGRYDPETRRVTVPKEMAQNYKAGQVFEYTPTGGQTEYHILEGVDVFTEEELKALKAFIAEHYPPERVTTEETKKKEETTSTLNKKLAESGGDLKTEKFTYDDKQVEGQRAERAEGNSESKPPSQVTLESLKALNEEIKRKDKKINTEILNHEIQVENIKRNNISLETKNLDAKATEFKAENIRLNEECKEIIHEFLETSTGYEVPQPLKVKFEKIESNFQKIWVSTSNAANHLTPQIMEEIITTKKEILSTIKSMITATGSLSKVSVGHDGTSR